MAFELKRLSFKHKNNKPLYYAKNYLRLFTSGKRYEKAREELLRQLDQHPNRDAILKRVEYYCRTFDLQGKDIPAFDKESITIGDSTLKSLSNHGKVYFFDTFQYLRYFPKELRYIPLFGDITEVPALPSVTKSRPISGTKNNSVLLKLDKIRHFTFVNDKKRWIDKEPRLVGRSKARQPHRQRFLKLYHGHPMCNIGQVNTDMNPQWIEPRMTIDEHLNYRFILCLEGNDVASNLKWVMSSNSLAVSAPLVYETWYMEGKLKGGEHFVEIKPDYSDLIEKMEYYNEHPKEAQEIIENAHRYVVQFHPDNYEELCSVLTLQKYFEQTGQLSSSGIF